MRFHSEFRSLIGLKRGSHDLSLENKTSRTTTNKPSRTITKSHPKWELIVNLGLWLVEKRVTWPFSREKNITNHHKSSQTTTNHHEPSRSLIQNEIWYWILDSDWLNSGSHDIFLRIVEKNHHETSRTTTNHHEPSRIITNHHEPSRNITKSHSKWDLILNIGLWLVK